MYRKIINDLKKWKKQTNRKPLIIQGVRYVGKTWSVLEFGRTCYENVAYFNFKTDRNLSELLQKDTRPEHLLPILSHLSGQTIMKSRTLVVFDEIDETTYGRELLKCFHKEEPKYHVVAISDSMNKIDSTEDIEIQNMYPLDLEEFMNALGEKALTDEIKNCFETNLPMSEQSHNKAFNLFRQYLVVGGIPSCVNMFAQTEDYILTRHAQNVFLDNYLRMMNENVSLSDAKKSKLLFDSIAGQLSKKNTQFQYNLIKKGGRASEFESVLKRFELLGITARSYRANDIKVPLESYSDSDDFKVYFFDVGLLCAKKDLHVNDILYMDQKLGNFKGGMIENYVQLQLVAKGYPTCYWESNRIAEMDFVAEIADKIVPVEIRTADNNMAKNLKVFTEKYKPEYAIKLSNRNFDFKNNIKTIPLYAAFCL